jgi:Protein of unknown function (DUF2924)
MPADLTVRLAQLSSMKKWELWALWKQLFKRTAPPRIRRELLIRILTFRIQEHIHGGLSAETRKRLRELARQFSVNPAAGIQGVSRIKPGTRLIRDWRGQSHHVTVLERGYSYAGKRYSSLSQIARLITGTRWSGPLFFGLKKHQVERHHADGG